MSCSEVMYQAYYPYLYQRSGSTPVHPVTRAGPFSSPFSSAHQYDRFNVQRLQEQSHASITVNTSSTMTAVGRSQDRANTSANATASVASSTGVSISYSTCNSSTPSSPRSQSLPSATASISLQPLPSVPIVSHKEDSNTCVHGDDSCCSDEGGESPELNEGPGPGGGVTDDAGTIGGSSRAQYLSANCVVITHYQGDAAAIVDEHFTKALDKTHNKEASPMSARNFPVSFWNSAYQYNASNSLSGLSTSDGLYHQSDGTYLPSDWYHQYSQYHHHHHHQHHHHSMAAAASYGGLLLPPPGSRLHMSAAAAGAAAAQCKAMDWQHAAAATLDNPYTSYPSMSGLEAQVQESSKDLYWF